MNRIQNDSPSESALSDFAKRKQMRREQGIEWSERMMKSGNPILKDAHPSLLSPSKTDKAGLQSEFLSLLIGPPETSDLNGAGGLASLSNGTNAQKSLPKEQVGNKPGVVSNQFKVSTQDFGMAEVDVAEKSGLVCMVVTVNQFVDLNQSKILEHLVAARLGRQFGKNFEVKILCKSGT